MILLDSHDPLQKRHGWVNALTQSYLNHSFENIPLIMAGFCRSTISRPCTLLIRVLRGFLILVSLLNEDDAGHPQPTTLCKEHALRFLSGERLQEASPGPPKWRELICNLSSYRSTGTLGMQLHHFAVTFYRAACTLFVDNASHEKKWLLGGVGSQWRFSAPVILLEDTIRAWYMISRVCGLELIK